MKYRSFYISSFQILIPTPVGVPIPGEVLVAEGIRVPGDIRVPEGIRVPEYFQEPKIFGYSTEKNWNYATQPEKMFYPHTPSNNYYQNYSLPVIHGLYNATKQNV